MIRPIARIVVIGAVLLAPALCGQARADQARFRFVPIDSLGNTQQVPVGPEGSWGELLVGYGMFPQPYNRVYRPTQMVTFRHPFTGGTVTVPMKLPDSTPRMEHRSDRIIYDYGSYTVSARFLADGGVDILYNSGFLRALPED